MDSNEAPSAGETTEQDVALPQHLTSSQQEHLRALLDGKVQSTKSHVRDSVVDFVGLKQQHTELTGAIQKATVVLQALRLEAASTTGAMNKCIRDVTRWEIESKPQANKPPASKPSKSRAKRKTKKKRGGR